MKVNLIRIVMISCFFSCLGSVSVYLLLRSNDKKIAVVDAVRLFNAYNMKKELEQKEKSKLQFMGKQLDSLSNMVNVAKASKNDVEIKRSLYAEAYVKDAIEKEYTDGNKSINEQVWKRLNPAIDEYGKQKGLRLIIGANGMGSVLYNDDYYDLTEDAIKYINKKYEEGN